MRRPPTSRSTNPSPVEEWQRAWKLAVNQFQIDALDCRELLREAQEAARARQDRREAVELLAQARARLRAALQELQTARLQLRSYITEGVELADERFQTFLANFEQSVHDLLHRASQSG